MSAFDVKRAGHHRYSVYRKADGARVSGEYSQFSLADAARLRIERESTRRAKSRARDCMTCGTTFMSEGAHNRMCDPCRTRAGRLDAQIMAPAAWPEW
ncbi:hypothetical protein DDZ14_16265 [Maritimibacter sp. 55A14]|uniref:hypothetical protein n=1 Tax=Maritimibacter sp. 55A14 TaxID=2174844 RepID=UPI000D60AA36|nr:hypothetical protein [Maritimibacter sp. 55A14]PWE29994.1 hypothetical protein DDZ14_16265 [Maritimibacter sp. 55A14]